MLGLMLACQASSCINMIELPELPLPWRLQGISRRDHMARRSDSAHTGTPRAGLCGCSCRHWCGWGWGTHPAGSWGCQLGTVIGSMVIGGHGPEGKPAAPKPGALLLAWDGHTAQAPSLLQRLWDGPKKLLSPTVQMGKLRHTGSHPCPRPSQSTEVVTLGQKRKTNGSETPS